MTTTAVDGGDWVALLRPDGTGSVRIRTRDPEGWHELHPMARLVCLTIACLVDADGQLHLGPDGLRDLHTRLRLESHTAWDEVASHIATLLAQGRLEYDEARRVVHDRSGLRVAAGVAQ